jgi:hypothetical protein
MAHQEVYANPYTTHSPQRSMRPLRIKTIQGNSTPKEVALHSMSTTKKDDTSDVRKRIIMCIIVYKPKRELWNQ